MVGAAIFAAVLAQAPPQAPPPEVVTRSRVDQSRGVDFHAMIVPETVYVGQQATYELGVFLDPDTRQRIRRNPEFQPPETRSLLSYDLRDRGAGPQTATIGGRTYETHVFRRAVFALTPGRYPIPQARLTYSLPQTSSFFSREENFTLRSEATVLVAIEPPQSGRPPDWMGAVGSWRATARIDTARGRAGDPLVFTVRVEGQGNVTLLPRPRLDVPWATVVNADERVVLDSSPPLLGGWKEFDWLVTPTMAGTRAVPPVRYAYFNPRTRRYEVATTAPIPVRVAPGDVAPAVSALPKAPAAVRPPPIFPALGDDAPAAMSRSAFAVALVVLAPLIAFGVAVIRRPKKPRPVPTPAQRIEAAAAAGAAGARIVRQALLDGIVARTGVDAMACTRPGALSAALRQAGVTRHSADAVEALLADLDAACFGPGKGISDDWAARGRDALARIDAEACGAPGAASGRRGPLAFAMLAIVAFSGVLPAQTASDAFALGATAYAGGDYVRASRHFADAARSAPRSVAAWANLGTAAMLAGDTAMAVVGWQRALRLAPLNVTIRERLATVRAPQDSGPARVPPVPEWAATGFALLVWASGWGGVAWLAWRRRPARRLALLTTAIGGLALAFAARVERTLAGRDLAVITSPVPLRALPALGAETRATPLVGEVADVLDREGVWVRVRLDGGRDGWIPAERVTRLGDD
jgi:tetratricopeptide (TPR) repeat protein